MTIGLAMNSVYYYQKEKDGETYSKNLNDKDIEKQGKQMASEILSRLRENSDLKDIPIHFAIYKQSGQDSIHQENSLLERLQTMVKQKSMDGIR